MITFEKLFEGVADHDQTFILLNRGYTPDKRSAGQWFEITEETYDYFLGVLPPLDFSANGFCMSEFATGYLTDGFVRLDGRFYCVAIHRATGRDFQNTVESFSRQLLASAV